MCGLYGFSSYSDQPIKDIAKLTNSLAVQSSVRGIDATGIAFCEGGNINVQKHPKAAYALDFKPPAGVRALIGHTRHSTQGSEKFNQNNHPFTGRVGSARFALAHNGVLTNDDILQKRYGFKSKIETDSYVAVQLIEQQKQFGIKSICRMAETVEGSFSFSILDNKNTLYLVKGDSPLSILHFPKEKLFVYASTDEILYKALVDSPLFTALKQGDYEEVPIYTGDILVLHTDGRIERHSFQFRYSYGRDWWSFGLHSSSSTVKKDSNKNDTQTAANRAYIEDLKYYAMYQGIDPELIDELLAEGLQPEEVEEYLYAC